MAGGIAGNGISAGAFASANRGPGLGCLPDPMDGRDRTFASISDAAASVKEIWHNRAYRTDGNKWNLKLIETTPPGRVQLGEGNEHFSPRNQGPLNTCTAHVVASLLQYLYREANLLANDVSPMFLYTMTRRLMRVQGDTGATLRATIKAAAKLGAPPEEDWPYDPALLNAMPDAVVCQIASHQRLHSYYRLDDGKYSGATLIEKMQQVLASKLPITCGIPVHRSIEKCGEDNGYVIPYPGNNTSVNDPIRGGHAVLIVGYDQNVTTDQDAPGAFIVLNSWGEDWGEDGYAYLPYSYVTRGLALDLWVGMIDIDTSDIPTKK